VGRGAKAAVSPMYRELAVYYDRIYGWKKYASETRRVVALARRYGRSPGRRWLDVACGTGRHLEYLRTQYDVTGVDLSPAMLREAHRRLPGVRLLAADMRSFDLGQRFDVVSCLFSAIGYLRTEVDLQRAFRTFARHLVPGGVVLVEPWLSPAQFHPGHISLDTYRDGTTTIVRAGSSARRGRQSTITFDYLLGVEGRGYRHVREVEHLRLTPRGRVRALLVEAGLTPTWVPPRASSRNDRGCWVGVAPDER
jgi:ubiquinone/menaquinone biosynthesis C-methylase UbiE